MAPLTRDPASTTRTPATAPRTPATTRTPAVSRSGGARDALRREAGTAGSYAAGAQVLRPAADTTAAPAVTATAAPATTPSHAASVGIDETALATVAAAVAERAPEAYREHARGSVPVVLRHCAETRMTSVDQVAYVIATVHHESHFGAPAFSRSESLVEDRNPLSHDKKAGTWSGTVHTNGASITGKTLGEAETNYWDSAYGGMLGNRSGTTDGKNYRGRGFVQLTGRSNYQAMSDLLNSENFSYRFGDVTYGGPGNPPIDLVTNYDHVNRVPDLAARITVRGMALGTFTGASLDDHINANGTDFYNARAIVNGDKARNGESIAGLARNYRAVLNEGNAWALVFGNR